MAQKSFGSTIVGLGLMALTLDKTLDAQTPATPPPPQRPAASVFRADQPDVQSRESLQLFLSLFEAFDDNVLGAEQASPFATAGGSGHYTSAHAGLRYAKRGRRVAFTSTGNGTFAYYPNLTDQLQQPVDSYDGLADLTAQIGRGRLQLGQTIVYQPYFAFMEVPGFTSNQVLLSPVNLAFTPEFSVLSEPATNYRSTALYETPVSRRSTIEFNYAYQGGAYSGAWSSLNSHSEGARFNYAASRRSRVHASYGHTQTRYDRPSFPKGSATTDDLEIGLTYLRPLSPTRSLRLDGGTGGSILKTDLPPFELDKRRNEVMAFAGFEYQFARTWASRADYRRALQVIPGLAQPYFGNRVSLLLVGMLSRKIDLLGTGNYSQGDLGSEGLASRGYDTRSASLRVRYALTPKLAAVAEYQNSRYSFGRDAVLPVGVFRALDRNVIRVGLTFGTSLLGRPTRP